MIVGRFTKGTLREDGVRKRDRFGRIALVLLVLWLCEYAYTSWTYAHDANILEMNVPEALLLLQALASLVVLPVASLVLAVLGKKKAKGKPGVFSRLTLWTWGALGGFLCIYMIRQL